jgi:hypothetical protein
LGAETALFSLSVRARIILLALVLCLAAAVGVQARGSAERESRQRLAEVERLIEEKRYNDAVRLLSQVVQEDPDRFDAAEELMEQIRTHRAEIDQGFADLNQAIRDGEPEPVVMNRVDRLEELNPYPSVSEKELLDRLLATGIKIIALQKVFEDLMARARAQIEAGEFRQAVSTYLGGFEIAREDFDDAGHGNIVINSVYTALDNLKQAIQAYDTLSAAQTSAAQRFGEDPGTLPSEVDAATAALQAMAGFVGTVERSGTTFNDQRQRIQETSSDTLSFLFLVHASQLVNGRANNDLEGIAYALDAIWRRELDGLESRLRRPGVAAYTAAVEQFRAESYDQDIAEITYARIMFEALLELRSVWPMRVDPARPYPADETGQAAFAEALPAFLRAQEYLKALEDYESLIGAGRRISELEAEDVTTLTFEQIYADRDELTLMLQELKILSDSWRELLSRYQAGGGQGLALSDHVAQAREVLSDLDGTRDMVAALDIRLFRRIAIVEGAQLEGRYQEYEKDFYRAVEDQEGREVTPGPSLPPRLVKYPARARDTYESLSEDLEDLLEETELMLSDALRNEEYLGQSEELQVHVRSLESLVDRIKTRQEEMPPRLEDASQAALQAERYKREGSDLYQKALSQAENRLYDQSLENLQIASEALDTSLTFQEDPEVRSISEDVQRLSQQIIKDRLDEVVREVRGLVEQGKSLYAQGDFDAADSTFRRAQAKWKTTFTTENEEVSLWLGLVKSAVEATSGREIARTDPLYTEMNQLYNLAYGDFQTFQELIRQDRRGEAQRVRDRAEDRLAKILIPFPYNAKARVLTLRILQLWDRDAFGERIKELYNSALALRENRPQEAYANLKDIEQLLPNYPGLQRAIADLEIKLGFRLPPPDPVDVAQSQAMVDQARPIWEGRQREFYRDAVELLNRAIQLNPDNREAGELKDRILIATGEGIEIVPDDETRRLLAEAQKLVRDRNYQQAVDILQYLLENPANRRNPQILDLLKLARARAGI